ncbi:hypothetical protein HRTV-25_gp9 [Halorubrum tailed virus 25]|uniref:Uncharacterized protein n=1 Tax=Halorubrum tailed virus 25 TaxID=2878006 RepID=A0AAE8XXN5_9CAUD|nr:hypothetical protein M1M37_gp009 [Halorubrum tailed virus 25]UBF22590.1 hypothetical protein HRTV-25_gp9 [Halorubrum tailed virus 25]
MAKVSRSNPEAGVTSPDSIEVYRVSSDDEGYMAEHQRPVLVLMWHGNGYKRDECWIQVDEDAACDLASWE